MIEFLIPLFTLLHARLGRRLRVLDPCHSNGKIIKHYEPYAGWIEFLHSPEMTAGGDFEVSHANLQRFKELNCDIAAFNPPWSANAFRVIMSVVLCLDIPVCFLCPSRCLDTDRFQQVFTGKELSGKAKMPRRLRFEEMERRLYDSGSLYWHFYGLPVGVRVDSTFGLPGRTVRMETAVHTPQREGENSVKSKRRLEQRKRARARALNARHIQTKTQAKGSGS